MAGGGDENLLHSNGVFEYQNRPRRDAGWTLAYVIFLALTVAFGMYGIANRNRQFENAFNENFLSDPQNCPYQQRSLLEKGNDPEDPLDVPTFFKHAAVWLVVSSFGSLFLGMVFLALFKHAPKAMVRITIQVQIVIPLALGIAALISKQFAGGIILLVMAGLAALCFYLWRNEIELCARLLNVAAIGLNQNPGLIFFVLVSKVALSLLTLPMYGLLFISYTNGKVVPNGAREGRLSCVGNQGQDVPCCVWQTDAWVGAYMALTVLTILWSIFIVGQLRVFVLSGTIAQWYFAPPDSPGATKGTTLRSIKHALGPSFGSLSFGAAILTIVQLARNAMEQARQNSNGAAMAVLWSLLSFFLECVFTLIEYITKFATIMASITGEPFLTAGRKATDLLKRNFLKSFGVWWFPPLVMQSAAFVLGATWGILVFLIYWLANHKQSHGTQEGAILGAVSFFVAWVVLAFFSSILLDIVDATYLCYAIDKDTQTITKPEVHDIYSKVPVGAAVENPGGEVQYGAPQPHTYVPPSHPSAVQNVHDSSSRV